MKTIDETTNVLVSKRFIIRKSLIGKNVTVEFTDYAGKMHRYNHDKVYEFNKDRFEAMACWHKYKYYSQTFDLPKFVREMTEADRV